eukprot:scaffold40553_cov66-Phaeocystis_antarctica.AAC.1
MPRGHGGGGEPQVGAAADARRGGGGHAVGGRPVQDVGCARQRLRAERGRGLHGACGGRRGRGERGFAWLGGAAGRAEREPDGAQWLGTAHAAGRRAGGGGRGGGGRRAAGGARHWHGARRPDGGGLAGCGAVRTGQRARVAAGGGRGQGEHRAQRGGVRAGGGAAASCCAETAVGGRQRSATPAEPARWRAVEGCGGGAEHAAGAGGSQRPNLSANPNLNPSRVLHQLQAGSGGAGPVGGVSSFGYSGTVAHAVLQCVPGGAAASAVGGGVALCFRRRAFLWQLDGF